jgi:hypothetical protein
LSPQAENDVEPIDLSTPDVTIDVPDMPILVETEVPVEDPPDLTDMVIPRPPIVVPTEAPRPSIALIPSPDSLPRQAAQPESPPATEPLQPLAAAPTPEPAPRPTPPPEPEPVAAETPEPDAPVAQAPQEARLPVAKPAERAAAARASSAPEPVAAAPEPAEEPKPAAPAGGSTSQFASAVTIGEKDALRLGIKQYFVYSGNRADRTLQVTIRIRLGQDAKIIGQPELLKASGGDAATQQVLFRSGRRALLKAQSAGEFKKLPPAKYNGWKLIHVTFTPEEIGFPS